MDSHSDSKKCGTTYRVQEDMGFSVRHRLCCYTKAPSQVCLPIRNLPLWKSASGFLPNRDPG